MFSRKILIILGFVAAASIALVNAAPTVNIAESGLALRGPRPVTETSLTARSTGEMGNYIDQRAISLALYTLNIGILGTFTSYTCMAFIAAPVNAVIGTFCAAGALATLGYIIASHWIVATKRDLTITDPRYHGNIILNYPQIEGKTATHSMKTAYSAFNETGKLLVGYHNCETTHCYNLFYENYKHPIIGTIHRVSQSPRGDWANSVKTSTKRSPQDYTDQDAFEQSEMASDGTAIFGTYEYWDTDATDENNAGNNNSGDDIADALFNAASTDEDFENQGYFCLDIIDNSNGGAVPSTGYFDVTAGENVDDPDNEQSYLEMCYDDELGMKRRAARRSVMA